MNVLRGLENVPSISIFSAFKKALFCFVSRAYSIPANWRTRRKGRKLFFPPPLSSSPPHLLLLHTTHSFRYLYLFFFPCVSVSPSCVFFSEKRSEGKLFQRLLLSFPQLFFASDISQVFSSPSSLLREEDGSQDVIGRACCQRNRGEEEEASASLNGRPGNPCCMFASSYVLQMPILIFSLPSPPRLLTLSCLSRLRLP